ncbi:MAG: galactokinase [Propionibacteriaceae bacterium]|jgi:galactokinase|nr:galactokinase [Propionibacteriaceae bacterium]
MHAQDAAAQNFTTYFGGKPEGVWGAPGRVNLIGEHTDYNAGLVLPIALPQRTYGAARKRDDGVLRLVSHGMGDPVEVKLEDIAPGAPSDWSRYPAGVVWALRRAGHTITGLDIAFASEVPVGSGLSSSAAIEGAIAAPASDLFGLGLLADDAARATLAGLCQEAENEIALAPTGGMDQAASLRCLEGYALGLDCQDGSVTQVPLRLAEADLVLLVINTRASHANADGQYGSRRADCEAACRELGVTALRAIDPGDLDDALRQLSTDQLRRRVRHIVTEIQRVRDAIVCLTSDDFAGLGRLFVASHLSMRDDYEISSPELDTAVATAMATGAIGARMTGGGFGGSAIALVPTASLDAVQMSITDTFADEGYPAAPEFIVASAAGGASRVG